ncbi:MAG: YkgJ family cysteine cluster protein [Deltaproteobacteria bacterium]|jgi:Fe-S-cluster containining protein
MTDTASMRPAEQEKFHFACHKELTCFTKCCNDLKLVLTPYDILRLKNHLQLSSKTFLSQYTAAYVDRASGLPQVRLKMENNAARKCPFLTPEGCLVYSDRPGACRLYPLGRAASKTQAGHRLWQVYFKVKESHCMGWQSEKEWTIQEWLADQGLDEYNAMNDSYMEISTGRPLRILKTLSSRHLQMYYMACYDLDAFRRFVFESSFRRRFDITENDLHRIRNDDIALMFFALRWLKFSLFGEKTFEILDSGNTASAIKS